jgi:hypothetical protein
MIKRNLIYEFSLTDVYNFTDRIIISIYAPDTG